MRVPSTMRAAPACAASQLLQALRRGHAAVHAHDVAGAEARDEALLQLRREVDLRHHHQRLRLRVARQQRCTACR
jgi:hypothetical protein